MENPFFCACRSLRARAYAHSQPSESDAKDTQNPVVHVREQSKEDVIRTFFDAFNRRDVHRMAESVADDCEHCNLAYPSPFRGKHAVVDFYRDFMKIVPHDASFEIEDTTGSSESSNVGVIWCVSQVQRANFGAQQMCNIYETWQLAHLFGDHPWQHSVWPQAGAWRIYSTSTHETSPPP